MYPLLKWPPNLLKALFSPRKPTINVIYIKLIKTTIVITMKPMSSALSKNLLEMKFMKRAFAEKHQDKEAQRDQEDVGFEQDRTNPSFWVLYNEKPFLEEHFAIDKVYINTTPSIFPRYSSQGFNPEVETLMTQNSSNKFMIVDEPVQQDNANTATNDEYTKDLYDELVKRLADRVEKRQRRHRSRKSGGGKKRKT
ncbi:hypothetical protein GJ496_005720 [Pomphorhynchus laevis]|nr:hypothetical protein GJ496_005720 [Pomphorhynchus laevis]